MGFFEFGGAHVVAGKDEARLGADAADVLAAVLLDEGLVLVAAVVLEHSADDDRLPRKLVGLSLPLLFAKLHLKAVAAQPLHEGTVRGIGKVADYAARDDLSDAVDLHQALHRSLHHLIHAAVIAGERLCRYLSDEADADGIEHALEGNLLAVLDRPLYISP